MPHSFTVRLNNEVALVLKKVESEIQSSGGRFEGDTACGSFDGNSFLGLIKGEYFCTSGDEIKIIITDKPFLVPYSKIETEIRKYFS